MDMEATASSTILKKKAPKSAFHGSGGGFFSQKKKVVLGNIKHSGDEKNISLSKFGSSDSVYSNVESLSSEDEDITMSGTNGRSLLSSAATTLKAKQVNTGAGFGSSLGSSNFHMNNDKVVLPFCLPISLEKKWIEPKIIKTPVEMSIRKSFALDINLSAVEKKSIEIATLLTREKGINVNSNLKKQGMRSDWAVMIKKILMDMPKDMIITAVTKFGEIKSIKIQLIGMWQKAIVEFAESSQADHTLLDKVGGKTCTINRLLTTGNRVYCVVVGFESEVDLESAFCTVPVFGSVQLLWARLDLVQCGKCGRFGHLALECDASDVAVPVSAVPFKKNALVVSLVSFSGSSPSGSGYDLGFSLSNALELGGGASFFLFDKSLLVACLASLECSFELLGDQVSGILRKLSFVELVLMVLSSGALSLVSSVLLGAGFNSSSSKVLTTKIGGLESKMLAMEALVSSVLAKLDLLLVWFRNLLCVMFVESMFLPSRRMLCIDIKILAIWSYSSQKRNFIGAGVAIIMDNSLACHVFKMEEISGRIVSVQLLFRDELSVIFLGLYAGASSEARFGQASEINSLIAKAVNFSTHVVLGEDFNKNGSGRSASFKFCLSLDLVNSFGSHYLAGSHMWSNSKGVVKTIDYIFVSGSLSSAVAGHQTVSVSDFFDTDHRAVIVSIGLGRLLDDCWKFKFKNADSIKWDKFRDLFSAKLLSLGDVFSGAKVHGDVDAMWTILQEAVLESADETFSRHWFSKFRHLKNRHSSKFFGLELLVAKIVKKFCSGNLSDVDLLVSKWLTLDNVKACAFRDLVSSSVKYDVIIKHLSLVYKDYRRMKMFESRFSEKTFIRKAIDRCMENFCSDKGSMIRSVLDRLFYKVVLDHLVVDDKLVLEPEEVKASYAPLSYVQNDAFSGVMHKVSIDELLFVISGLPNGKVTGLSGILNELWKQGGKVVLGCMLALFNVCLIASVVPVLWKRVWISMISKPYDWDGVFTNTQPIALIETARKILFKILFDYILVACSKFNVLQDDNFLVLKGTSTQSLVFAIGSVVEDALKKN
ncbi:hypothetical protein G9A89_020702 [Geosiphon pyriformis]|nr:hypothetical protein G9A89_020702 [Geosiphon pyriformis]